MTRLIHNHGQPFQNQDGTPLVNIELKFELVDSHNKLVTVYDAISKVIIPIKETIVTLDENGEFEVNLWPNSRGTSVTFYRVTCLLYTSPSPRD